MNLQVFSAPFVILVVVSFAAVHDLEPLLLVPVRPVHPVPPVPRSDVETVARELPLVCRLASLILFFLYTEWNIIQQLPLQ